MFGFQAQTLSPAGYGGGGGGGGGGRQGLSGKALLETFAAVMKEQEKMETKEFNNDETYQKRLNQVRRPWRADARARLAPL